MREHYVLGEVARILGRRPHQIVYPITTGKIPEPESRVAGRRLFTGEDVKRIARHLGVCPNWDALDPPPGDGDAEPPARLTLRPPFELIQVGETGHEIRDCDGELFAWVADRGKGLVLAGLLESAARG